MKKPIEIISKDITRHQTFSNKKIYVIDGEIHVRPAVKLTIQDQALILLKNGVYPQSRLRRSALIFDQGSRLVAKRVFFKACSAAHRPIKFADNGGLWFLGNYKNASKDGVSVKVNRNNPLSSFSAHTLTTHYLGRHDSTKPQTGHRSDDIDGFSVLGVSPEEWNISCVRNLFSADDGIDVTNSHIRLDRLEIKQPLEDGMNISSSRVEIHKSLVLDVSKTKATDRDLFDLETDDGASFVELYSRCWVRVRGVFGDQVVLSSTEMPRPNTKDDNEQRYLFKGQLKKAALIYSIDQD